MFRRDFIKALTLIGGLGISGRNLLSQPTLEQPRKFVFPPRLESGDTIAFTAPGSPCNFWEIQPMVNFFKSLGLRVVIGEAITKRDRAYRYLSQSDEFRAREFMDFVVNPEVKAIIAARGGYGCIRILPYLDFDLISSNPKTYLGFSDFTSILIPVNNLSGLITFYSPTGNYYPDSFTKKYLLPWLMKGSPTNEIVYNFEWKDVIVEGECKGELLGGNLTNLTSLLGTKYDFETNGKILFFEEVSEEPYRVDRMLKQLELAGKFEKCNGVIVGYISKLDARRKFYPDYSFTLRQVLVNNLSKFGFPVVINFPFGHFKKFMTIPIGVVAELSTKIRKFYLNCDGFFTKIE